MSAIERLIERYRSVNDHLASDGYEDKDADAVVAEAQTELSQIAERCRRLEDENKRLIWESIPSSKSAPVADKKDWTGENQRTISSLTAERDLAEMFRPQLAAVAGCSIDANWGDIAAAAVAKVRRLDALLSEAPADEQSMRGVTVEYREDDGRHYVYRGDKVLWSGRPTFNAWKAALMDEHVRANRLYAREAEAWIKSKDAKIAALTAERDAALSRGVALHAENVAIRAERDALATDIERLNQMLRDTGYGQGQIDAYAAQCEELERLRAERDALAAKVKELLEWAQSEGKDCDGRNADRYWQMERVIHQIKSALAGGAT